MALKKYEKDNQVYQVSEGSLFEQQLISDGFEEIVEDKKAERTLDELKEEVLARGLDLPDGKLTKKALLALLGEE